MKKNILLAPANAACCPKATITIKDTCESFVNLDTTTPVTIFNAINNGLMAVSFYVDQYTAGSANGGVAGGADFTVTAGGVSAVYSVQNGCTTIVVDTNITTITVKSFSNTRPLTARVCYRFYEKSFL